MSISGSESQVEIIKKEEKSSTIGGVTWRSLLARGWGGQVGGRGRGAGRECDSTCSKGGIKGNMGIISRESGFEGRHWEKITVCVWKNKVIPLRLRGKFL